MFIRSSLSGHQSKRFIQLRIATAAIALFSGVAATWGLVPTPGQYFAATETFSYAQNSLNMGQVVNNLGQAVGFSSVIYRKDAYTPPLVWGRAANWSLSQGNEPFLSGLQAWGNSYDSQDANAINAAGVVAGSAKLFTTTGSNLGTRAVRWGSDKAITQLGDLGTDAGGVTNAAATALNEAGTTVGYADDYVGGVRVGSRPVRWAAGSTTPTRLGDLGTNFSDGSNSVIPVAINNAGDAVGSGFYVVNNVSQGTRALRWNAGTTTPIVLPNIVTGPGANVSAIDINESGRVLGQTDLMSDTGRYFGQRGIRWSATGQATELLPLGYRNDGHSSAAGYAMNDAGLVVGFATRYVDGIDRGSRPTRWDANSSTAAELDNLGIGSTSGYLSGSAYAVNNSGAIVGTLSYTAAAGYENRAILWSATAAGALDLNDLLAPASGWRLRRATAISDTGVIVGDGQYDPDGSGPEFYAERYFSLLVPQAGTYGRGDANFDTLVNFDDLLLLAQHYGETNSTQAVNVADFNLDGSTNFDDLLALSQHYAAASSFAADWTLAQSLVPEPAGMFVCSSLLLRRRRRRSA